jgi:hypothetical protein
VLVCVELLGTLTGSVAATVYRYDRIHNPVRGRARTEIYIDRSDAAVNKELFDKFASEKAPWKASLEKS